MLSLLDPKQRALLREWFVPDRPGPLIGLHVIQTGNGSCRVDRWPDPRAVLTETAGNYSLAGEPEALEPADLIGQVAGFVEAPERFAPLLKTAFPAMVVWDRVILELRERPHFSLPATATVRRLEPADAYHVWGLSPASNWIGKTWGGPAGLAASGYAWGVFVEGRLVSVANVFFVGQQYEDLGVVTEPRFRGLGLSVACAGAVCEDILARGRWPSWTTSPDNSASLRVAEKLGFSLNRHDCLYVVGITVPQPARPAE
jgi:RimJ/RimL family protein N-acetyltransferase